MRSWMIGLLVGLLPVGLLSGLPPPTVSYCLALLSFALIVPAQPCCLFLAGVLLGSAWAMLRGELMLESRLAEPCNGRVMLIAGYVSSLPRTSLLDGGTRRQRFEFRLTEPVSASCGKPARFLLSYYGEDEIRPGQRWRFEARMKKPWGLANPGSFNMQSWYARTAVDGVGSVRQGSATYIGEYASLATFVHRLRQRMSTAIDALPLGAESRAVLMAVTVADKSGIDNSLWTLFQHFGINHLLVVSGLHVGLVAGVGYLLGGLISRSLQLVGFCLLWPAPAAGLMLALVYTTLAGFSVPTQRALCMLACFLLAGYIGRRSTPANSLLLAAVLVLVINPLEALGSGFWLSFSAVAALLWLGQWHGGQSWLRRSLACHGFLSLVMLPLGGWWFGGASLISAPANLLMVPVVGLLVVPLALLGGFLFLLDIAAADSLWVLAALPVETWLSLASGIRESSSGWMYVQHAPDASRLMLGLIAVILAILPLRGRIKLMLPALLLPLFLGSRASVGEGVQVTRVTVLDVGQGTSIVVSSGTRALVYDTGGGDPAGANMALSVLLPYLRSKGITQLDTLVISHGDRDHSAGMRSILAAMPPVRFRRGPGVSGREAGVLCRAGEAWRWPGGQQFQFLSPAQESGLSSNNGSCVLRIDTGGRILIIPGDIDGERERQLVSYWEDAIDSDWLHLAHHGSATSTSLAWVKNLSPDVVVISSGNASRFGHPHPDVLARLDAAGIQHWSSAAEGALEFIFAPGRAVQFSRFRAEHPRFWM